MTSPTIPGTVSGAPNCSLRSLSVIDPKGTLEVMNHLDIDRQILLR